MTKDEALKLALEALEDVDGIDTETECVTIDVGDVMDAIKQALAAPVQEPVKPLGLYEHRCPQVTGHRGPSFVCQKAGHGVNQDSYCNDCTCTSVVQPAPMQPDKHLQLALEALVPLEKLFKQADSQGLLTGANVDCQIATIELRKSAYAASDIRAHLNTTPPAAQRQWVGLTGQQKNLIARISVDVFDAIHRTEAKLKEKNHG